MTSEPSRAETAVDAVERLVFGVVWLAVAVAIALGAAGVASALDHPAGTAARPELSWAADSQVIPELEAAEDEIRAIATGVEELSLQGRGALSALAARNFDVLDGAVSRGSLLVASIDERSRALAARLAGLEAFGPGAALRLSSATIATHARLVRGADATNGLSVSWLRLTQGALAASRLSALLAAHDERITAAIEVGREGQFEVAFGRIDEASEMLEQATDLRDQLAATATDVATLDEWLRRNRQYDEALRALYVASEASPDRVTPELRAALRNELAARDQLPRTTNGLSIVMADIARGGLNQAVIGIEQVRGRLAEVLAPAPEASPAP